MPGLSEHDLLREHLADRDVPCPSCGYNLRALTTDRCPECNLPLKLTLDNKHLPGRLWLFALAGLWLLPAGSIFVLLFMAWMLAWGDGPSRGALLPLVIVPACLLAGFGGAAAWLAGQQGRTRMLARAPRTQCILAITAWLGAILVYAVWLLWLLGWFG